MPFHFFGGGPNPSSLKLSDSGQIPVSIIPMMTLFSINDLLSCRGKPRKSHDRVVWSLPLSLGNTETMPSFAIQKSI